jgi:hypothetical protein
MGGKNHYREKSANYMPKEVVLRQGNQVWKIYIDIGQTHFRKIISFPL